MDTSAPEPAAPKLSPVEGLKERSRFLRGNIVAEMTDGTDHVSKDSYNLLKFHGTYQQEDRDARKTRSQTGINKQYIFMVRCKIPGGKLTAEQYLALDALADEVANGTLRFTTRQGIQFHGVLKENLHAGIAGINATLLTTLGACGDVERNVMCCPAPIHDGLRDELQRAADLVAAHFAPRSTAYHEIWLNGERLSEVRGQKSEVRSQKSDEDTDSPLTSDLRPLTSDSPTSDQEPIYGKTYLPRKFKTGVTLRDDNCIDIYAQDLGFVADVESNRIAGYNVLVGGGMGMTHGNAETFPFLAKPICWIPAPALLNVAEAVIKLYRDHGNRADRKRARIKYLVHDWGAPKFRKMLEQYVGGKLARPKPMLIYELDPHLGWHSQGDGRHFYGLSIENGRVKDEGNLRLRTALRKLVERLRPNLRLTPMQDVLLCDLAAEARAEIEHTLAEHGVLRPDQLSTVQKLSMACPAMPTCGLALSESERVMPGVVDQLERELKRLGLENEKLTVRMTGCPNGCARPYQSDIGIVGRSGDKYTLFVGGRLVGDRLNFVLQDLVPLNQVVPMLVPLLEAFRDDRKAGEGFGDYCTRLGVERLQSLLPIQSAEHAAVKKVAAS